MFKFLMAAGLIALAATHVAAKDYRVGYIDSDEVVAEYEAAKEAKEELDAEIDKFRAEADSLREEYELAKEEYESQELTLSEEGKRAKMAEIEQRKRRYDGYLDQVYREGGKIDQKNKELIAPIVEKIEEAVTTIAEDEGFALIIDASKSEIVFSEPGLDLTDLVIAELNRGIGPVGEDVTGKIVYAVFPVFEDGDEARQEDIGNLIRQFASTLAADKPSVDMTPAGKINDEMRSRGLLDRELTKDEVVGVAIPLNADYGVFGKCRMDGRRVEFDLSIVDVGLNRIAASESGSVARQEELNEEVARVVQVLLTSVEK